MNNDGTGKPIDIAIICEGESELLFFEELKRKGMIKKKYILVEVILFKSWGRLKRINTIHSGIDKFIFVHDTDDTAQVGQHIEFFRRNLGDVILNSPNFDYFCGEFLNIKWNKDDKKDVLRKLSSIIKSKKGKKLDYEVLLKKGDIKNIKNPAKYGIIDLIDF